MQQDHPAQRALSASTLSLLLAVAALLLFMPPFFERFLTDAAHLVANGLVLSTALLLHWAFLAIAARRMKRWAPGWLAPAVLLFPVGGAAALILLRWFGDEAGSVAPSSG